MNPDGRRARDGRIIQSNSNGAWRSRLSVSRLAQEHGVNANLLFKWRRHYRAGLFDEVAAPAAPLPVSIRQEPAELTQVEPLPPACVPAPEAGLQIAFNDCTVRVSSSADLEMLRAVLMLLRR